MFLITGNKGFIGRHVQAAVEKQGTEVYGLDRLDDYNVLPALARVPWERIEKIIHLGAVTDTRRWEPEELWKYNVEFSTMLMRFADQKLIPLHYASSSAVYGNNRNQQPSPLNQYALSKLSIDYYFRDQTWNTNIVGFRLFNVYGMDERKGDSASLVNKLIHSTNPAIFKSSGAYFRDFVCVEDVVEVLLKTYKNGIYDIGSGDALNLVELADEVMKYTGYDYSLIPMPKELKCQYQEYTRAINRPDELEKFKYKKVADWLLEHKGKINGKI